jgi:hypothetical protein
MKIFLGWSGLQSLAIAKVLEAWLPEVIPAAEIFHVDIDKTDDWVSALRYAMEGADFAIICPTRENRESEWIHFVAGALFNMRRASVHTFLFGLKPTEVPFTLSAFRHISAENRDDVFSMVQNMNFHLRLIRQNPLKDDALLRNFEKNWMYLENCLIGVGRRFSDIK